MTIGAATDERRCSIYLHYDADDVLLYVGITDGVHGRAKKHAYEAAWPQFASYGTFVWCANRAEAKSRERELIKTLHPIFNQTHASAGRVDRARAYLESKGRLDLIEPPKQRRAAQPASTTANPTGPYRVPLSSTVINGRCFDEWSNGRYTSHSARTPHV